MSRQTTERTQPLGPDWTAEGDGEWCDTMVLDPASDDAGHSATMIMAPQYAVPAPDAVLPARDVDTPRWSTARWRFSPSAISSIASAIGEDLQVELPQEFHTKAQPVESRERRLDRQDQRGRLHRHVRGGCATAAHHAERAGKAIFLSILALQRFTPWLAARLRDPHGPRPVAVAGLNSGRCRCAKNLRGGRAAHRTERTIIGDTVNVASSRKAAPAIWLGRDLQATPRWRGVRASGTGREGQIVKGRVRRR